MQQTSLRGWRRASQILFFAAFLFLLARNEFRGSFEPGTARIHLPYPVSLFLELDPLVALSNALATATLYRSLVYAVGILVATLFLNRFFCGWICPLGSIHHFFGNLKSERKRGTQLIESNQYRAWQSSKYYLMAGGLVAATMGALILAVLDPISLLVRSFAVAVLPALNAATDALLDGLVRTGWSPFARLAGELESVGRATFVAFEAPISRQSIAIGLLFLLIVAANVRVTRFWCRALCPLGALLGIVSRWSPIGLQQQPERCDQCRLCLMHCQGGDDPIPGAGWRKAECHACFNCVADCPQHALQFGLAPASAVARREPTRRVAPAGPDLQRRKLLASVAAGAGLVPLLRASPGLTVDADSRLIRPPGAVDERHFLARCLRCGQCMKVCPNNALHPALFEGGFETLWTPIVVPTIGYCEPGCTLCSQVCPTGAIWELTEAQRSGADPTTTGGGPVKIGTAFYDRGRCLPWSMATPCIVCEEWCPVSPKAIYLIVADVTGPDGRTLTVKQPCVDPNRCIGCGACEHACPVRDQPAVYVTSVGETRSKTNQFILKVPPPRLQRQS